MNELLVTYMWAAKGEVNICRVFLENFSGDQVGPRGHRCPPTYQYTYIQGHRA